MQGDNNRLSYVWTFSYRKISESKYDKTLNYTLISLVNNSQGILKKVLSRDNLRKVFIGINGVFSVSRYLHIGIADGFSPLIDNLNK